MLIARALYPCDAGGRPALGSRKRKINKQSIIPSFRRGSRAGIGAAGVVSHARFEPPVTYSQAVDFDHPGRAGTVAATPPSGGEYAMPSSCPYANLYR